MKRNFELEIFHFFVTPFSRLSLYRTIVLAPTAVKSDLTVYLETPERVTLSGRRFIWRLYRGERCRMTD